MQIDITRYEKKNTVGGIKSEWNEVVEQAMGQINNLDWKTRTPWTYKRWAAYLHGIPSHKIHQMLSTARSARKPEAMFNYLVKAYRAAQS